MKIPNLSRAATMDLEQSMKKVRKNVWSRERRYRQRINDGRLEASALFKLLDSIEDQLQPGLDKLQS